MRDPELDGFLALLAVRRSPDGEEETSILYDRAGSALTVDRTRSSRDAAVERDLNALKALLER